MGKLLEYVTLSGITVGASYWYPEEIHRNKKRKDVRIVFLGYNSKADKDQGKAPLSGAIKEYNLTGNEYDAWYADSIFEQGATDLSKQAYLYADQKLDVDSGTKDQDGVAIMQSFFKDATDDI